MRAQILAACLITLAGLWGCVVKAETLDGRTIRVIDGDTVRLPGGEAARLYAIDAPEIFGARLPEPPPLHVLAATRPWPRRDRPGWPTIEDVLAPLRAGRIDEARRPAPPPHVSNEAERMRRMRKKLPSLDWTR